MDMRRKPLWETGEPGVPALPGQEGTCDPHDDWSDAEKWAWEQIRAGREADFHEKYGFLDPRKEEIWQGEEVEGRRMLSANFLCAILMNEPWQSALTHMGVRIFGALFADPIDLRSADIICEIVFLGCRIEERFSLLGAHLAHSLILSGSYIHKVLEMDGVVVNGDLFMRCVSSHRAEFSSDVRLIGVQVNGDFNVNGSCFGGELIMDGSRVAGGVNLSVDKYNRSEFCGDVRLVGVRVDGPVNMVGSRFKGQVLMDQSVVAGDLHMNSDKDNLTEIAGNVTMRGLETGGQVAMTGSLLAGGVALDGGEIKGSLLMNSDNNRQAEFCGKIRLHGIQVVGQVNMEGSNFADTVDMSGAVVNSGLFMRSNKDFNCVFEKAVRLIGLQVTGQFDMSNAHFMDSLIMDGAVINGNLFLEGTTLARVDANHTKINGAVELGGEDNHCTAMESLNLAGARVESIVDDWTLERHKQGIDPWPRELTVQNFSYNHLHGHARQEGWVPMTARPASWFKNWLGRQKEFSPQPYEHCAKVLRAAGAPDTANEVLYECKEQERERAKGWRKFGLTLMKASIGYGLGTKYFRALGWAAGLVLAGFLIAWCCGQVTGKTWPWFMGFSLDQLLPVISMSDEFDPKILSGWPWAYFIFLHKPLGFVLASFVVAGLAGVGQHKSD